MSRRPGGGRHRRRRAAGRGQELPITDAVSGTAGTVVRADAHVDGAGPWVHVRVEDTGNGIAAERLDEIFEPFRQGAPEEAHQGTGLGLAVARRLARLMAGDLTVRSDVGAGSRFMLWLPVAAVPPVLRRVPGRAD